MAPLDSPPISTYLNRPLRSLPQACREASAARGEAPPCDECGVADICDACRDHDRAAASGAPDAAAGGMRLRQRQRQGRTPKERRR
jgi:hypothetical protein